MHARHRSHSCSSIVKSCAQLTGITGGSGGMPVGAEDSMVDFNFLTERQQQKKMYRKTKRMELRQIEETACLSI
jgi:hypothetical protein